MESITNKKNFKNAFKCKKCPGRNDEEGCPMWWEYSMEEPTTGKTKLVKECGYLAMPVFLTSVISASNRPAAEIGQLRNEIAQGFTAVANNVHLLVRDSDDIVPNNGGLIQKSRKESIEENKP